MGKVTEELVKLITKQVDERGIVVWYDPERAYGEVAASLTPPDTTVLHYSDGFFELRHRIDPLLEFVGEDGSLCDGADIPPRLVVYVPRDRGETQYALIEVEAAGVVMEPGANPWQRNNKSKSRHADFWPSFRRGFASLAKHLQSVMAAGRRDVRKRGGNLGGQQGRGWTGRTRVRQYARWESRAARTAMKD